MRKTAIACGVVGVVLLVAAALLAWWITPSYIARLQGNSNTVRTYDGQIRTLVDPAALRAGNLAGAIRAGLPETLRRQVTVLQTSGNTALVKDATTLTTSGRQIGGITSQYAVDRTSLEATASHPSSWSITSAKGLTFNWPIPAQHRNYTGWVPFTETTTALKYVKQEPQGGVNTYVYQATVPPTPIKNPQVLRALPASVPVSLLQAAEKARLIPASLIAGLARAFPGARTVPLGYVYESTSTYWVAPATGIVVNLNTSEIQVGGVALPNGRFVPLLPVLADSYKQSSSSVQAAATDATNDSNTITTWNTTVPIAVVAVGFVLVVIAVFLWIRGRRHGVGGPPHGVSGPSMDPAHADTRG
jgi:Porin PorA